jgi:hypothetical protein
MPIATVALVARSEKDLPSAITEALRIAMPGHVLSYQRFDSVEPLSCVARIEGRGVSAVVLPPELDSPPFIEALSDVMAVRELDGYSLIYL